MSRTSRARSTARTDASAESRFSKTGRTVYYRGLERSKARGISGNFIDLNTGHEYWVSGVKRRGSNVHPAERTLVVVDEDALAAYADLRTA